VAAFPDAHFKNDLQPLKKSDSRKGRVASSCWIFQRADIPGRNMNRRKKLNQILKANAKKASAKLAPVNKDRYISKADRLKMAAESGEDGTTTSQS